MPHRRHRHCHHHTRTVTQAPKRPGGPRILVHLGSVSALGTSFPSEVRGAPTMVPITQTLVRTQWTRAVISASGVRVRGRSPALRPGPVGQLRPPEDALAFGAFLPGRAMHVTRRSEARTGLPGLECQFRAGYVVWGNKAGAERRYRAPAAWAGAGARSPRLAPPSPRVCPANAGPDGAGHAAETCPVALCSAWGPSGPFCA